MKDAVHFEKVVDRATEASWTIPEEESPETPEVHEEEHGEEEFPYTGKKREEPRLFSLF